MQLPRLRQAVLVAADLASTCERLTCAFDLRPPYADPGVAEFGLANAVFEIGDTFLEVVSPVRDGTAAGRYLEKNGGDGGYMVIFQVDGIADARARIAAAGARVVWQADLPDISGTHIHPKDIPGAIVSIDEARPPETWHWAGPRWTGRAPTDLSAGGVHEVVVAIDDPAAGEERWRQLVGAAPGVRFVPTTPTSPVTGVVEIRLDHPVAAGRAVTVGSAVVRAVQASG